MNPRLRTALLAVIFVMAAALTYLGVTHWPKPEPQTTNPDHTIAGIDGLVEGEVISFPALRTLKGEPAPLNTVATEKFLFVFFTPSCAGCSLDAALWRSLNEESAKRSTAVYLIDVGHDRTALQKFVEAYDLESLPVLISEGRSVGQVLKVNIVPLYLLVAKGGKVLHRWDGVRRYEQPPGPEELAKFFQ
jgi:peroxiredoxin